VKGKQTKVNKVNITMGGAGGWPSKTKIIRFFVNFPHHVIQKL